MREKPNPSNTTFESRLCSLLFLEVVCHTRATSGAVECYVRDHQQVKRQIPKRRIMTTIFEQRTTDSPWMTNGNGKHIVVRNEDSPTKIWKRISINEWTFSLFLFLFSLSICLGKIYTSYGNVLLRRIGDSSVPSTLTQIYDKIGVSNMSILPKFDMIRLQTTSEKLLNASDQYVEEANVLVTSYDKYGFLIKALISGLAMTSFTWFIVYMDSNIPGINPPFPLTPPRQRIRNSSRIQTNYLVGIINGILFTIYMCL